VRTYTVKTISEKSKQSQFQHQFTTLLIIQNSLGKRKESE
jgi:hypothetical protein